MHWTEKREAVANIGSALRDRGWTLYGWREDQSDMMTDYYSPESWDGVAEKGGVVLVVNRFENRNSGGRTRTRSVENGQCPRCNGDGWEPDAGEWSLEAAMLDPQGYSKWRIGREFGPGSGVVSISAMMGVVSPIGFDYDHSREGSFLKCLDCHGTGIVYRLEDYTEPWPEFQANPERRKWHAEKGGRILCSGIGLSKATGYGKEGVARAGVLVDTILVKIAKALKKPQRKPKNSGGGNDGAVVATATSAAARATLEQDRDWLWLTFPAKPADGVLVELKALGGRWSRKRQAWYFTDASVKSRLQGAIVQ